MIFSSLSLRLFRLCFRWPPHARQKMEALSYILILELRFKSEVEKRILLRKSRGELVTAFDHGVCARRDGAQQPSAAQVHARLRPTPPAAAALPALAAEEPPLAQDELACGRHDERDGPLVLAALLGLEAELAAAEAAHDG